jgi:anti-sigma factor RsiW
VIALSDHSEFPTRSPGCEGFQDDIAVLATGTLDGCERSEVLCHLDFCLHCAALYQEFSEVVRALEALIPLATGSSDLTDRILASRRPSIGRAADSPSRDRSRARPEVPD